MISALMIIAGIVAAIAMRKTDQDAGVVAITICIYLAAITAIIEIPIILLFLKK